MAAGFEILKNEKEYPQALNLYFAFLPFYLVKKEISVLNVFKQTAAQARWNPIETQILVKQNSFQLPVSNSHKQSRIYS